VAGGPIGVRSALAYDVKQFLRITVAKKRGPWLAKIEFTGRIVKGTDLPNHLGSRLGVREKRNQDSQPYG
jgi:hypothetical protein